MSKCFYTFTGNSKTPPDLEQQNAVLMTAVGVLLDKLNLRSINIGNADLTQWERKWDGVEINQNQVHQVVSVNLIPSKKIII